MERDSGFHHFSVAPDGTQSGDPKATDYVLEMSQAVNAIGFRSVGQATRAFLDPTPIELTIECHRSGDDVETYKLFEFAFSFRNGELLDPGQLRPASIALVIAGCTDPLIATYAGIIPISTSDAYVPIAFVEYVRTALVIMGITPLDLSTFRKWPRVAINAQFQFFPVGPLHSVYYNMGYVGRDEVLTKEYARFLAAAHVTNFFESGKLTVDGPHSHVVTKFASVLSKFVDVPIPVKNVEFWVAAVYETAMLQSEHSKIRKKMAMAGDYLLKSSVAIKYVGDSSAVVSDLSNVFTSKHTNAHMSLQFAQSSLVDAVICSSNVNLGSTKIGADFLEAIAFLVFSQGGVAAFWRYASRMGMDVEEPVVSWL